MAADQLNLHVLGAAGGYPYGGHACSGFLLTAGDFKVLLDCGPGVALKLLQNRNASDLDAIVLSHFHPDHSLDLISIGYALMSEWIKLRHRRRVRLFLPAGGVAFFENFAGLFGHKYWQFVDGDYGPGYAALGTSINAGCDWMFEVFDVHEFKAGDKVDAGNLVFATIQADHTPEAVCLRVDHGDKRLAYTADTKPFEGLSEFCRDADVLITEGHISGSHPPGGAHMTPRQAGQMAHAADAKRVLLTHIAAMEDAEDALGAVRAVYDGPVELAGDCSEKITL